MDSIIAQRSCLQALLVYHDLKDCFNSSENELFFLDELVYGEEFVIILKGKKEGLEIEYYNSGEKLEEIKWKDGKREGLGIIYRFGVKWFERHWKDNKREGLEIGYYYNSGKKQIEMNWKNDKPEGLEIRYYESGKKEYEKVWKKGELISEDYY